MTFLMHLLLRQSPASSCGAGNDTGFLICCPRRRRDLIARAKRVWRQFVAAARSGGLLAVQEGSLEVLIRDLLRQMSGNRRQIARITSQTAVAVIATYILLTWIDARFLSWGIISALFTIGVSADASYYNALGRIFGRSSALPSVLWRR